MATDWQGLLPHTAAQRVIESAVKQSVALKLGTVQPMPAGVQSVPVVSVAPTAGWVDAGARKPIATIEWSSLTLEAREIAAVTAIPDVYLSDTAGEWSPTQSAENELAKAVARVLDAAILWGVNAPPGFPVGGIVGTAPPAVTGADALEAIDNALTAIENDGLLPNGIASSAAINAALRAANRSVAALPAEAPSRQVYGVPVEVTAPWDSSKGDAIVGDWTNLVIGVRQDINFDISTDGVLVDSGGAIQISAFQDDQTLVRVTFRAACALATPLQADGSGTASAFAIADWTTP
jgi:HK97 family phage major capsid protein